MIRLRSMLLTLLVAACPLVAQGQTTSVPSEQLLPPSTQAWVSIADLNQLSTDLKATQFGQLAEDPAMQTFIEDLKAQLESKREGLGLTWDDMLSLAGGETALALIHEEGKRPAHVAIVDITGKLANVPGVVLQLEEELKKRGATPSDATVGSKTMRIFTKDNTVRLVYFKYDNQLVATDSRDLAESLIARLDRAAGGTTIDENLAKDAAFIAVRDRLQRDLDASQGEAEVRWFVNPIGMAIAQRKLAELDHPAPAEGKRRRDFLQIAKETGFDGVKGAGGILTVRTENYDILSRIAVYAPRPWEKSLNMITLTNTAEHVVGEWVNRDVASHSTFQLDLVSAFDSFKWLFDATVGDDNGAFDDVMEGIAEDPLGPQVNIRDQILGQMTGQVTLVTDNLQPINVNSQRRLIAMPLKQGQADSVGKALNRLMAPDEENAKLRENLVPGVEIWELLAEKASEVSEVPSHRAEIIPVVSVTGSGQDDVVHPPAMHRQESAAVCVANGQLLYASHISFLVEVLQNAAGRHKLAVDIDLQNVNQFLDAELNARGWNAVALRRFGRTEEEIRTSYELARDNRLHESESIIARLVRNAAGGTLSEDGEQWFDGSKLPDFQIIRRFLQPTGSVCHAETQDKDGFDGWVIISMTLRDRRTAADKADADGAGDADAMKVDDLSKD